MQAAKGHRDAHTLEFAPRSGAAPPRLALPTSGRARRSSRWAGAPCGGRWRGGAGAPRQETCIGPPERTHATRPHQATATGCCHVGMCALHLRASVGKGGLTGQVQGTGHGLRLGRNLCKGAAGAGPSGRRSSSSPPPCPPTPPSGCRRQGAPCCAHCTDDNRKYCTYRALGRMM